MEKKEAPSTSHSRFGFSPSDLMVFREREGGEEEKGRQMHVVLDTRPERGGEESARAFRRLVFIEEGGKKKRRSRFENPPRVRQRRSAKEREKGDQTRDIRTGTNREI